jgi:hypothetical protein
MAKKKKAKEAKGAGDLGFEAKLWLAAYSSSRPA